MENNHRHLRLVSEFDPAFQGPITRMGLWYRFPPVAKGQVAYYIVVKLVLLSVLYFYVYGSLLK